MRYLLSFVVVVAGLIIEVGALAAQPVQTVAPEVRMALLIGNDTYAHEKLRNIGTANVGRDLELLSGSFRKVGFDVEIIRNRTARDLRESLKVFGERARRADVSVVYFTGFGVQVEQADYFAGVDADVAGFNTEDPAIVGYIPIAEAVVSVQQSKKFAMVVAEANRSDPWRSTARGLAKVGVDVLASDSDVVVFYGSQSGTGSSDGPDGGNGPFAMSLAKRMLEPGIEVGLFARRVRADVIRMTGGFQRPQLYGELGEREFYFSGAPKSTTRSTLVVKKQPRLALVIGNSDYNQDGRVDDDRASAAVREQGFASDLPNATNDARDIATAFGRMNFSVDLVENADYKKLLDALFSFEKKIIDAGEDAIVAVFYAGHALQIGGGNFLVPVGAKLPSVDFDRLSGPQAELMLTQYALPLQTALLGRLKNPSKQGLNLVFLDACRENPWERRSVGRNVAARGSGVGGNRSRGLGEVRIDLRRTAIAFATKPGDVAEDGDGTNSPYTLALKSIIEEPGLSVVELLNKVHEKVENDTGGKQVTWTNTPALGRTCLGACLDIQ